MRNLTVPRDGVSRRERVRGLQPDLRTAQSPLECEKRARRKIRPSEKPRKLCSRGGNSDRARHPREWTCRPKAGAELLGGSVKGEYSPEADTLYNRDARA
jgi:hypothetical protein